MIQKDEDRIQSNRFIISIKPMIDQGRQNRCSQITTHLHLNTLGFLCPSSGGYSREGEQFIGLLKYRLAQTEPVRVKHISNKRAKEVFI